MSAANIEAFEASLQALQHVPLQAALVTDHEGVVLLRAGERADDASLQRMAANYSQTSEQVAGKLKLGKNRTVTAMYENAVVVHASCSPLVLTLMAAAGTNVGLLLDAAPQVVQALEPLRQSAETLAATS
mmetsp:Transcript_64832/g.177780  ORF Transcript_64832/g.177780 Transcript_64832/m.177780 type:complete len:130 (-) Transcript_64832:378-767(-)